VGIYFRKRKKIAPGLYVNLTNRGAGISAGPRHAKVSANTRGRSSLSLSLRGLIYRRRIR
jgi:hypothetical protein